MSSDTNFFDDSDSQNVQNTTSDFNEYFVKTPFEDVENKSPDTESPGSITPTKERIALEMEKLKSNFDTNDNDLTPTKERIALEMDKLKSNFDTDDNDLTPTISRKKINVNKIKNDMKNDLNKQQSEIIKEKANSHKKTNYLKNKQKQKFFHSKNVVIINNKEYKGYDAVVTSTNPVTYRIKLSNETDKNFIKIQTVDIDDLKQKRTVVKYIENNQGIKERHDVPNPKIIEMRERHIDILSPNYKLIKNVYYAITYNNTQYVLPAFGFQRIIKHNGKYGYYDKKINTCSMFAEDIQKMSTDFIQRNLNPDNYQCDESTIERTDYYMYNITDQYFGLFGKIDNVIEKHQVELQDELTFKKNHIEFLDKNKVKIKVGIYKNLIGSILYKNEKSYDLLIEALGKNISSLNNNPITDDYLFFKDILLKTGKYVQIMSLSDNGYDCITLNGEKIHITNEDIESVYYENTDNINYNSDNTDEQEFVYEPEAKIREDDGTTYDEDDENKNTGEYDYDEGEKDGEGNAEPQKFGSSYKDMDRTSLKISESEETKNIQNILKSIIKKLNMDDKYINDYQFVTDIEQYLNIKKKNQKKWDDENDKFIILAFLLNTETANQDSKSIIKKLLKEKFFKSTKNIDKLFDKFETFSAGIYKQKPKSNEENISYVLNVKKVSVINIDDYIKRSSYTSYDFSNLERITWYNYTHILKAFKDTLLQKYNDKTCNEKTKEYIQYVFSNIESAPVILNNTNLKNKKNYAWLEKAWNTLINKVKYIIDTENTTKMILKNSDKENMKVDKTMFAKYIKSKPNSSYTNEKTTLSYKKPSSTKSIYIDDDEFKKLKKEKNKRAKLIEAQKRELQARYNSIKKQKEIEEPDVPSDTDEQFDLLLKKIKMDNKKK